MPIYEYELTEDECLMCPGRFAVLQEASEPHLKFCPHCGLPARRVISGANVVLAANASPEAAAKLGFSTYRKAQTGIYEKVAGPGVDVIASDE